MSPARTNGPGPVGLPHPIRAFAAQARVELLLTVRRPESLLVTLVVPVALLVFFSSAGVLPSAESGGIDELAPGIFTLAVIAVGQVSFGVATAFERGQGVLKRLRGSPLPAPALFGAKALAVACTEAVQLLVLAAVAAPMGWAPSGGPVPALVGAVPWLALGTLAFASFGLLLAAALRPETARAAAYGFFLLFVLLGGAVLPLDRLPAPVALPASFLPPALLADLLRGSLVTGHEVSPIAAAGLGAWAIGLAVAAVLACRASE